MQIRLYREYEDGILKRAYLNRTSPTQEVNAAVETHLATKRAKLKNGESMPKGKASR